MKKSLFLTLVLLVIPSIGAIDIKLSDFNLNETWVRENGIGERVSLESIRGKATIQAYFQTWCSDCIREIPTLIQLKEKLNNPDVKIIMVTDESIEKVNKFKKRFPLFKQSYFIAEKSMRELDIKKFPTTVLLDRKGNVKLVTYEGHDWSNEQSMDLVTKLLK